MPRNSSLSPSIQTKPNYYILGGKKNLILREHYRAFKRLLLFPESQRGIKRVLVTVLLQEANEFFEFNKWGCLGEGLKLPLGIF